MLDKLKRPFCTSLLMTFLMISAGISDELTTGDQWDDPFAFTKNQSESSPDSMNLENLLSLVLKANPTLKAGLKQIEAAEGLLIQAGLWSNPELEIEFEEVGWDAPGLQELTLTVVLSQEIELWGNRKNRKQLARQELSAIELETKIAAFDIYATTVERYFALGHAQRRSALAQDAVDLAADIAETARIRVIMGAAMQSELLLGQLEMETAALELAAAVSDMETARTELASLWNGEASVVVVAETDFDPAVIAKIDALLSLLDGSREVRTLDAEAARIDAELDIVRSEAKPNLSLSGGFKRTELNGSNSFVIGVGFPLPLLNRNQGNIRSLEAGKDALTLKRQQALLIANAEFETSKRRIEQQESRYRRIKTGVLPKAEETFLSLKSAYDKGKLPYSILLESQRMLLDLRFELNDIGLAIIHEIVTLERLLGVTIR